MKAGLLKFNVLFSLIQNYSHVLFDVHFWLWKVRKIWCMFILKTAKLCKDLTKGGCCQKFRFSSDAPDRYAKFLFIDEKWTSNRTSLWLFFLFLVYWNSMSELNKFKGFCLEKVLMIFASFLILFFPFLLFTKTRFSLKLFFL